MRIDLGVDENSNTSNGCQVLHCGDTELLIGQL